MDQETIEENYEPGAMRRLMMWKYTTGNTGRYHCANQQFADDVCELMDRVDELEAILHNVSKPEK